MLLGKDDDDWTTKDTQMGERKKSAHLDDDPKKEWRKNEKKCPSFFFCLLHFLPSLFTFTFWTRIGRNCEVDSHTALLRGECPRVSLSLPKRENARRRRGRRRRRRRRHVRRAFDDDAEKEIIDETTNERGIFLENDETIERKGRWVPTLCARSRSDGGRHKRR